MKSKYQLLFDIRENAGIEEIKNPEAFTDHPLTIDNPT